jgi:hypothetical protein
MERPFCPPRNQFMRRHQHLALAADRIVTDDLLAFASFGPFNAQIGRVVLQPVARARHLFLKLARDDPRHCEPSGSFGRSLGYTPVCQERQCRDDGDDKAIPETSVKTRHEWLPASVMVQFDAFVFKVSPARRNERAFLSPACRHLSRGVRAARKICILTATGRQASECSG